MKNNIISMFTLVIAVFIYNTAIKRLPDNYNAFLASFFYISIYGWIVYKNARDILNSIANKFDKWVLGLLTSVFGIMLMLNVFSLFGTWEFYKSINSNSYIDSGIAFLLIISLILLLCQRVRISGR